MALGSAAVPSTLIDDAVSLGRRPSRADVWIPAAVLAIITLACFFAPALFNMGGPSSTNLGAPLRAPLSPGHLLGTDALGNDMLTRSLFAGRISLEVGVGAVLVGFVVGGTAGVAAGFFGGITDTIVMRVLDVFLCFPPLVLALVAATYLGPTEYNEILAIAFFTAPAKARLARATTLRLREEGFVEQAMLAGATRTKTMAMHLVPNVVPPLMTFALLNISAAIMIDAILSFLGAGVRPPTPTWGNMIAGGEGYLRNQPWIVFVPGAFLLLSILSLNLLGDALRRRIEAR